MKGHIDQITDAVMQGIVSWRDGTGVKTPEQASELSKLSNEDLRDRIKGYVEKLPEDSLAPLANGEAVKGNKVSTLTTDIQRVIASPNQAEVLRNFEELNASKYDAKANFREQFNQETVLGNDILYLMKNNKKDLKYHDKFMPATISSSLSERPVTQDDLSRKDVIVGLAAGMLAKIAGQNSEFSKVNKSVVVLPDEVIKAAYDAAIQLAKNPPYNDMDPKQAVEAGKKIGKEVRAELFKDKANLDVQGLANVITSGRVVKGKDVGSSQPSDLKFERRNEVDVNATAGFAEKLAAKSLGVERSSSSSSRDSGSEMKKSSGGFAAKEEARAAQRASKEKGGVSI